MTRKTFLKYDGDISRHRQNLRWKAKTMQLHIILTTHGALTGSGVTFFVKWSILATCFNFFRHEEGMMGHFCNEKV